MAQMSAVPMLPHRTQSRADRATPAKAWARGAIKPSRRFNIASTARRADLGPKPGKRDIRSIRASISRGVSVIASFAVPKLGVACP